MQTVCPACHSMYPLGLNDLLKQPASVWVHALPVTAAKLSECSRQDPLVSLVMQFTHRGWSAQ